MEKSRECKHLGNPPGQDSGGKYASKFFWCCPNFNRFIPLLDTSKKRNKRSKFTREGMEGTKPITLTYSAHQIYGKVPAKICHQLIEQNYWFQETRQWDIYQNMGATYTVWRSMHHILEKIHEPKLFGLRCTGKIIGFTVCRKCINSDGTWYGLHLEAWCSRHSYTSSIRKQAQEGKLTARKWIWQKML